VDNGIYPLPQYHLILVHIQIPDTSLKSLGPGAVHAAVGIWWVALDDRVPSASGVGDAGVVALRWQPPCVVFKTTGTGTAFDVAGGYLWGPGSANLSRYPLSFNPEDSSIRVALSPADEVSVPRTTYPAALKPTPQSCTA
jgi:hypothetical protein